MVVFERYSGLLFLLALVLAWPTFGLSVVVWIALKLLRAGAAANRTEPLASPRGLPPRDSSAIVEELVRGRYLEFFTALGVPKHPGAEQSDADSGQCGKHVVMYMTRNGEDASMLLDGVAKLTDRFLSRDARSAGSYCDVVTAAETERDITGKGEIHLAAYIAVEALMKNNPNLRCFDAIDLGMVMVEKLKIDLRTSRASGR